MAILELRAARGWSLAETARRFLLTPETISSWIKQIDEDCAASIVKLREPVNKFPQYVHYLVQRLKVLCPTLGKAKIAQVLGRAGLHLGATTVGRILNAPVTLPSEPNAEESKEHIVTAKYPNHVWHVDLTTVPTAKGFWTAWSPFSLPQSWPFCFWFVVIIDHYSRRVMAVESFKKQPSSRDVQDCLKRTIQRNNATPKQLICDKGSQFTARSFYKWAERNKIKLRHGAVGKHDSIAIVERFIRTLKEFLRSIIVPYDKKKFELELDLFCNWYNEHRPHEFLEGKTPNEVYLKQFPKNRKPRFEPRSRWPRGSPCAKPWGLVRGKVGAKLEMEVNFLHGRKHLPILSLKRVA
jgi:putative transposase